MKVKEAIDYCDACRYIDLLSRVHAAASLVPFVNKDVDDVSLETLCKARVPASVIRMAVTGKKECPKKTLRSKA